MSPYLPFSASPRPSVSVSSVLPAPSPLLFPRFQPPTSGGRSLLPSSSIGPRGPCRLFFLLALRAGRPISSLQDHSSSSSRTISSHGKGCHDHDCTFGIFQGTRNPAQVISGCQGRPVWLEGKRQGGGPVSGRAGESFSAEGRSGSRGENRRAASLLGIRSQPDS